MVSSDLKYKLMRHVTFNPLLFWIAPDLMYFYMKYNYYYFSFSVVHFFLSTSVSTTFYIFLALSTLDDG